MSKLSKCPLELTLARTPASNCPETIVVSSWQQVARRANKNFCAIINDATGRRLFFKHNLGGNFKYIVTDAERRRRDVCNILASHILTEIFALHCVVYRDSFLVFPDGHRLRGVICDYLEESRWLQMVPLQEIINQKEGLWQIAVLTWLGDIDRLNNPGNDLVTRGGMYVTLDFDFCFSDGVSVFGLPIANRLALKYFMQGDRVESITARILGLTDADIAGMIERVGRDWISDWSEDYQSHFIGVLIRNRERLRGSRALQKFDHKMSPLLRLSDYLIARFYRKIVTPRKVMNIVRKQGLAGTILELQKGITRLINSRWSLGSVQVSYRRDSDFYADGRGLLNSDGDREVLTETRTGHEFAA